MNCDDDLRATIAERLAAFERWRAPPGAGRAAAVAVAVAEEGLGADVAGLPAFDDWQAHAAIVLTRRAESLKRHRGQWALPGGRLDPGETAETAALREMDEEIGLRLAPGAILGCLDDYVTRSGFVITPVVAWVGAHRHLVPNEDEVASIHRIPVREFLRDDAPMLSTEVGADAPVLRMPVGDSWIAAPTAAVLYQFREVCLRGLETRVSHFDQPRFAWR